MDWTFDLLENQKRGSTTTTTTTATATTSSSGSGSSISKSRGLKFPICLLQGVCQNRSSGSRKTCGGPESLLHTGATTIRNRLISSGNMGTIGPGREWGLILREKQESRRRKQPATTQPEAMTKEQRQLPPFEGHLTTGFSSTPDQPGAWLYSNSRSQQQQQQPQPPTSSKGQRIYEPKGSQEECGFRSTPDQPSARFQSETEWASKETTIATRQRKRPEGPAQNSAPKMPQQPPIMQTQPEERVSNNQLPRGGQPRHYQFAPTQTIRKQVDLPEGDAVLGSA